MKKSQQDGNAEPSINKLPAEEQGNLDYSQLIRARVERRSAKPVEEESPPETEEVVEEQPDDTHTEEETAETEGIAEESEVPEQSDDVLSQIDLSKLSKEDIDKLREVTGSRAVERFGQLTAKAKAAEEERDRLRAQLAQLQGGKNPLDTGELNEPNPYKDIDSLEKLQEQYLELQRVRDWAEEVLDDNEHASFDDIIVTEGERELTKRAVKKYLRDARKSIDKFLPARARELQNEAQGRQLHDALEKQAADTLSWYSDPSSDLHVQYKAVISDPRVKKIAESVPEVAPQLNFLLAHAVNSMYGLTAKPKAPAKKQVASKPPTNPASGVALGGDRPDDRQAKKVKELESRFEQSGSMRDFQALRALSHAKRYK